MPREADDLVDESVDHDAQAKAVGGTTTYESIRRLLAAHKKGDDSAFRAAVHDLIQESRRKKHHQFARELERVLNGVTAPDAPSVPRSLEGLTPMSPLPRDRDKNATLLEEREPELDLDDLVLDPGVRARLDLIVQENRQGELLRAHGYRPQNRLLFCGPPGCGKTAAAGALAKALYLPLVVVRFDAVVSSYLGETAANLRRVFDFARVRPVVVLFDEFDAIGKSRTDESEHGELKRVVNAFLQMLDGFRGHAILIAATNHERLLDQALWRRFDEILTFPRPTQKEILELLIRNLRQIGLRNDARLDHQAQRLVGQSHADVVRVAIDASKVTILSGHEAVAGDTLRTAVDRQAARKGANPPDIAEQQHQGSVKAPSLPSRAATVVPAAKKKKRRSGPHGRGK